MQKKNSSLTSSTAATQVLKTAFGYYLWPGIWLDSAPTFDGKSYTISMMDDEIYRKNLSEGIEVKVTREGFFIFDFSNAKRSWLLSKKSGFEKAVDQALLNARVMNVHLLCLYHAIGNAGRAYEKMVLGPSDLILKKSIDSNDRSFANAWTAAISLPLFNPPEHNSIDWKLANRTVMHKKIIANSFTQLDRVLTSKNAENLLMVLELTLRSSKAFEDHDYALSLITSWACIENMLAVIWEQFIERNKHRIDASRRDLLNDGRAFTASVIIETLTFARVIPVEINKKITIVRKARNNWIHSLKPVESEAAFTAVKIIEELLLKTWKIDLDIPMVRRVTM